MLRSCMVLSLLLVAACAQTEPEPAANSDTCGAERYQGLVGAQLAAVILPAGLNMTVIEYGAAPPSPADPSRMLFQLDAEGRIARVYCG